MNLHFKAILRRLVKNKSTSLINILGLAVGVATTLILLLYVQYESNYDRFHAKADNLYQVFIKWGDGEQESVTPPLGQKLLETFPEIEAMARYVDWDDEWLVSVTSNSFKIEHAMGADNQIFDLLNFDFIRGNPQNALDRPKTVILNETTAKKIFGDSDPLGVQLIVNSRDTMEVTGVVQDFPRNSSIQFNILYSIKGYDVYWENQWMNHTLSTFILLNENSNIENLRAKMPEFTKDCLDPFFQERDGRTYDEFIKSSGLYLFDFKNITDVHLGTITSANQTLKSRLNLLLLIGSMIFIIACINYTNLSTVQLITRAKEIGIKKVTGSSPFQLIINSYLETAIVVFLSIVFAYLLMAWFLPFFNRLTDRELVLSFFQNPLLVYGTPLTLLFATILAGTYPAIKLARISPRTAFQGVLSKNPKSLSFRNILVVGQFVVCIAMVTITILFAKQINFITSHQLGFDPDQILVVKDAFLVKSDPFKNALLKIPEVESASYTNTVPGRHFNDQGIHVKGTAPSMQFAHVLKGDYDLKEILNLELVAGRWFSEDIDQDKGSCILNETALKSLNIQDPLSTILDKGSWSYDSVEEVRIIGVVKDFNFKSLQSPIQTMAIYPKSDNEYLCLKLSHANYREVVSAVKDIWDQQTGNLPFEFFFLNQDFNRNYQAETQMRQIFLVFSLLAIFVTCLGLLGISSFLILRRTKEIGIRKVNGANISQIIRMLNYDFIKWVVIAFVIASPVAYYASSRWLETFAYKTPISWWIFAVAGLLAVLVALATVSWQSWRTAIKNPVEALRYE